MLPVAANMPAIITPAVNNEIAFLNIILFTSFFSFPVPRTAFSSLYWAALL